MSLHKLKTLSLFSGIGGIDRGLEETGFFETVAFCEIDKHCHKVLNKHWPEVPIYEDVANLDLVSLQHAGIDRIDAIVGGFPCQDVSVAGKQKGLIDENGNTTRSGLWFEYKRLIKEIRPKYVIIENVRNLLSNGFARVLKDINEIGYDAEWYVISARDVGACHLRERLWIIAYPNGQSLRGIPKWSEIGRDNIQTEGKAFIGNNGEEWNPTASDSDNERFVSRAREGVQSEGESELRENLGNSCEESRSRKSRGDDSSDLSDSDSEGFEGRVRECGECREVGGEQNSGCTDELLREESSERNLPDTYDIRLWRPFATKEEKQLWGSIASISVSGWWQTQPSVCRVANGLPAGLHESESFRKQRIRQLGNAVVPQILTIIGNAIYDYEARRLL